MRKLFLSLILTSVVGSLACGQEASVNPGINKSFDQPNVPQFVQRFETEGRDVYDHRDAVIAACGVRPGMAVADVGAGTGLFTRMFSKLVGPTGKVYAVDISEEFVHHILNQAHEERITNIEGFVCKPDSVELPAESVDLVFICDTYHHFEYPLKTMQSIYRALRSGGKVVLVDFQRIPGVSSEWTLNHVRAGQEVFVQEIVSAGFKKTEERQGLLTESYFVRFEKVDEGSER